MIYLISGASRSGKSIVAKRLMSQTGIPYMPIDSLMMGFMNGIPSMGVHDKLWPDEIAEKIWSFLRAVCENMIDNDIDYIFEGEAILPHNVIKLIDMYPDKIKVCFMGFCNISVEQKIIDVKKYSNGKKDWLVSQNENYIRSHIENMIFYSRTIKEECEKFDIKYIDTAINFSEIIDYAIDYLIAENR